MGHRQLRALILRSQLQDSPGLRKLRTVVWPDLEPRSGELLKKAAPQLHLITLDSAHSSPHRLAVLTGGNLHQSLPIASMQSLWTSAFLSRSIYSCN